MNIFEFNNQRKNPQRCTATWDLIDFEPMPEMKDVSGIEVREYKNFGEYMRELNHKQKSQ
jgi:hypothetical protein